MGGVGRSGEKLGVGRRRIRKDKGGVWSRGWGRMREMTTPLA